MKCSRKLHIIGEKYYIKQVIYAVNFAAPNNKLNALHWKQIDTKKDFVPQAIHKNLVLTQEYCALEMC